MNTQHTSPSFVSNKDAPAPVGRVPADLLEVADAMRSAGLIPSTHELITAQVFTWRRPDGSVEAYNIYDLLQALGDYESNAIISVSDWYEQAVKTGAANIDPDYAATVSLRDARPPILMVNDDGMMILLDGNHRMYRMWTLGKKDAHVYAIPRSKCLPFRLPDHVARHIAANAHPVAG